MSKTLNWRKESYYFAGLVLVTSALLCNTWTLKMLFSRDGRLALRTEVVIWFMQLLLIVLGSTLILIRPLVNSALTTRHMFQAYPRRSAAVVGMVLMLLIVFGMEMFFFALNVHHRKGKETVVLQAQSQISSEQVLDGAHIADAVLGYKIAPNTRIHSVGKAEDRLIYEVDYTTDKFSRRVTPWHGSGQADNFALFFGCSFMFGQGVKDDETLPYYAGQLTSQYRPYNYGGIGYGPQQMLAKLQEGGIREEVAEHRGVLVYLLIGDHVNRAIGTMQVHNERGKRMPYYALDSAGRLVRRGNFVSGRPLLDLFYSGLALSQTAEFFQINFPRTNNNHVSLTARMISKSRNLFSDTFHSDRFYVVLFPGEPWALRMKSFLEDAGVQCLDYGSLIDVRKPGFRIPGDPHPTPQVYKILAQAIAKDVGLKD